MPLQRASQGTLSTIAMLGLIDRFLRALDPTTKPEQDVCERSAIVIIDELDAHLHPSWQRMIVPVLRETFPNVQFIVSAHSPLIISECLESEVVVLRKTAERRFVIEPEPALIGNDLQAILRRVFETDPSTGTLDRYLTMLGNRPSLKEKISILGAKEARSSDEETEFDKAEAELSRLNRAELAQQQQIRIEDREEYEAALKERISRLEARAEELQGRQDGLNKKGLQIQELEEPLGESREHPEHQAGGKEA